MISDDQRLLLRWIEEREAIRLKRATNAPSPWTEDHA